MAQLSKMTYEVLECSLVLGRCLANNYFAKMEHIIPISAQLVHPPWVDPLIMSSDRDASLIHRTNGHVPVDATAVILSHTRISIDEQIFVTIAHALGDVEHS